MTVPLPEWTKRDDLGGLVPSEVRTAMVQYAAAVSAADNAALRAELATHQESQWHPDWSLLVATREALAEHRQIIAALQARVKVLEDALKVAADDIQEWGGYASDYFQKKWNLKADVDAARAALKEGGKLPPPIEGAKP